MNKTLWFGTRTYLLAGKGIIRPGLSFPALVLLRQEVRCLRASLVQEFFWEPGRMKPPWLVLQDTLAMCKALILESRENQGERIYPPQDIPVGTSRE